IFLAVFQVRVSQIVMSVGRVRVGEEVQLKDLNGLLRLASMQKTGGDNVDVNFGKQLRLRIFSSGVSQLLRDLGSPARQLELVEDCRTSQRICRGVPGCFD